MGFFEVIIVLIVLVIAVTAYLVQLTAKVLKAKRPRYNLALLLVVVSGALKAISPNMYMNELLLMPVIVLVLCALSKYLFHASWHAAFGTASIAYVTPFLFGFFLLSYLQVSNSA